MFKVSYTFVMAGTEQHLKFEGLWLLPGEVLVGKVSILGRLVVDRLYEVQVLHDDTGSQVEVGADDLDELVRGLGRGTVSLHEERQRLGHTDSVR